MCGKKGKEAEAEERGRGGGRNAPIQLKVAMSADPMALTIVDRMDAIPWKTAIIALLIAEWREWGMRREREGGRGRLGIRSWEG